MNESKIPVRYSKALFDYAHSKGVTEEVERDMRLILNLSSTEEFILLTTNPVIRPSKKKMILEKAFANTLSEPSMSLCRLVVDKGRESYLAAIARYYITLSVKERGLTDVLLTTAVPVSEKIKERIATVVAEVFSTMPLMKERIDKDIVGGFILQVDDKLLDASVRTALRRVTGELSRPDGRIITNNKEN